MNLLKVSFLLSVIFITSLTTWINANSLGLQKVGRIPEEATCASGIIEMDDDIMYGETGDPSVYIRSIAVFTLNDELVFFKQGCYVSKCETSLSHLASGEYNAIVVTSLPENICQQIVLE